MSKYSCIVLLTIASRMVSAQDDKLVFNAFKQGSQKGLGNCASVAAIKAAIGTYGVGNVFTILKNDLTESCTVMLRSGKSIFLTSEEMAKGIKQAAFVVSLTGDPEYEMIKGYADTCFAVMCKNLAGTPSLQSPKKKYSLFDQAASDLNDGFSSTDAARVLGLKVDEFKSTYKQIRSKANAVLYNAHHGAFTSYGFYDEPGDNDGISAIEKFRWKQGGLKCLFLFCGPSGSYEIATNEFELNYFSSQRIDVISVPE